MISLRTEAAGKRVSLSAVVEEACIVWMEKNVSYIDRNGCAILNEDQDDLERRNREAFLKDPDIQEALRIERERNGDPFDTPQHPVV